MNRRTPRAAALTFVVVAVLAGCGRAPSTAASSPADPAPPPALVAAATATPSDEPSALASVPADPGSWSTPAAPTATPSDAPDPEDGEVNPDDLSWKKPALAFAKAYTHTSGGYQAWIDGLQPWVSEYVLSEFSTQAMFGAVPAGGYQPVGVDVVVSGDQEMRVVVRYDSTWLAQELTLTRQDDPDHPWVVAAVTRPAS